MSINSKGTREQRRIRRSLRELKRRRHEAEERYYHYDMLINLIEKQL